MNIANCFHMWTLFSLALASPPTDLVTSVPLGTHPLQNLLISGDYVLGSTAKDVWLLDIDTWEHTNTTVACGTSVTGLEVIPTSTGVDIYAVCDDGKLFTLQYTGGAISTVGSDATPGEYTIANSLAGIWWDGYDPRSLYAIEDGAVVATIHTIDQNNAVVNSAQMQLGGFTSGVVDTAANALYISHGQDLSIVDLQTGSIVASPATTSASIDWLAEHSNGQVWAVDSSAGAVFEVRPNTSTLGQSYTGYDAPVAMYSVPDEWLGVVGAGITIHRLSGNQIQDTNNPVLELSSPHLTELVGNPQYAFAGGANGSLHILTASPWVSDASVSRGSATEGDEITVSFVVSEDADWKIVRGDRTGTGETIASGTAVAGQAIEEVVTVDGWVEGLNALYILATDSLNNTGHERVEVIVDSVPDAPVLPANAVEIAQQGLILTIPGVDVADLSSYEVYVSDTLFSADDFPDKGGPESLAVPAPQNPITKAVNGTGDVTVQISPLEYGQTYYIGVRVIDAGGLVSPMSNVIEGQPEESYSLSDLVGEKGGSNCSTGAVPTGGMGLGLGLAALFARRRRRWSTLTGGALILCGLGLGTSAEASGDETPQVGNFELRYGGFFTTTDDNLAKVLGPSQNMLQLEFGPQFFRFFELDLEVGFYQELGFQITASGGQTGIRTMLTQYPLGLSGTFRLQLLDEQVVVPHARLGADYVFFSELTDDGTGGKKEIAGTKVGYHYAFGLALLLDTFAPGRASLLEAQSGINDTYIIVEWRSQQVDGRKLPWSQSPGTGFDFSGTMLTVGVKIDY